MLKTQNMPTELNEQMVGSDGLDWLKVKGWVIETTKLGDDTTFQQTNAGRKIAQMSDRQLLKEMVDERGMLGGILKEMRGNIYFWVLGVGLLLTLSIVFKGSWKPWWDSITPAWMPR